MDSSIVILLCLVVLLPALMIALFNPMVGLTMVILVNPFDNLIPLPMGFTIGRALGVVVALAWLFRYLLTRRSRLFFERRFNLFALLLILEMLVSSLLSVFPGKSMGMTLTITFLILMFFFVQDFVLNEKHLRVLMIVIAMTFGGASIIGILQFLGFEGAGAVIGHISSYDSGSDSGARFAGLQTNPNGYGLMLMSGIPFLLFFAVNGKTYLQRALASVFLLTSVVSLYLAMSRTHVAGLIVFSAAFLFLNFRSKRISRKQFLYLGLLILFFLLLYSRMPDFVSDRLFRYTFSGQDTSGEERKYILLKGIELLQNNPVFGVGFAAFPETDSKYARHLAPGVVGHDLISVFFASTGLLGALIFIFLCYKTFKYLNAAQTIFRASKNDYLSNLALTIKAAFIAVLSTSFGQPIVVERIFWVYLAIAALLYRWGCSTQTKAAKKAAAGNVRPISALAAGGTSFYSGERH